MHGQVILLTSSAWLPIRNEFGEKKGSLLRQISGGLSATVRKSGLGLYASQLLRARRSRP